ncbi:TetR/AcrR family transcriptional regulator [Rhodovibrio salinarum]|uniref:TetR/AcrR family transcriptional regulator n=1 Tax=Rhodovibrio salinarum TaxID=1087 RepID=A0A934QL47_9PROT|nr:TetR/AcrR family transcriptional regulator [Rhodovibrio salinarum]MBK1698928.1 TetR/AcrR family transcriptional regulator [Rhodovibrio salinarum]
MVEAASAPTRGIDLSELAEHALTLADERGWNDVALRDVAKRAGLPLAQLYRQCPSKWALLRAHARHVDAQVAETLEPEDLQEPAKDRLFEVLMNRFDALGDHKPAVRSILECTLRDPAQAFGGYGQLRRSMTRMLQAADLSTAGVRGELRVNGLCGVYLLALRTWLDDDSADLSKTMAALDGYLRRIERPAEVLEGRERARDVVRDTVKDSPVGRGLSRMVRGAGSDADGPVIEGEATEVPETKGAGTMGEPPVDDPHPGPGSSAVH